MIFAVDDGGGIRRGDLCTNAFVAIGCQRGGHVRHYQASPAVKLCNWENLSAQGVVSFVHRTLWPRSLNTFATRSPVCAVELRRLTAMFTLLPLLEQASFVRSEVVYLRLGSFSHCVQTCKGGIRNWIVNSSRDASANAHN